MEMCHIISNLMICMYSLNTILNCDAQINVNPEENTVLVVMIPRHRGILFPYFFPLFEKLNYPKESLSLFIRSDHHSDKEHSVLYSWLSKHGNKYHSVNIISEKNPNHNMHQMEANELIRQTNMNRIRLKEEGLAFGRAMKASYVWFLDMEALLTDSNVLQKLMREGKMIVSPMLQYITNFSNFWGAMTSTFWYKRSDDYFQILNYDKKGCFPVPLVIHCVLVNLKYKETRNLSFNDNDSYDINERLTSVVDMKKISLSARQNMIEMNICNRERHGFGLLPPDLSDCTEETIEHELRNFGLDHIPFSSSSTLDTSLKEVEKYSGFNKIYCINLERRPNRKKRMQSVFASHGMNVTFWKAIDGNNLNSSFLSSVKQNEAYKRNCTVGEIGNYLSHFSIWKEVVDNKYKQVIVFEDDAHFYGDFKDDVEKVRKEIDRLNLRWDFVYLGRLIKFPWHETEVYGSYLLVKPTLSYGTFGYLLSFEGAKKLISHELLKNFLPTDGYITARTGMHPTKEFNDNCPHDLNIYALKKSILRQTHSRIHEEGYISDTETSPIISQLLEQEKKQNGFFQQQFLSKKTEL